MATYSRNDACLFSMDPSWNHAPFTAQDSSIPAAYRDVQSQPMQTYTGHNNARTFLKEAAFLGGGEYVTTGSDCGHAFVWEKRSGTLVQLLQADKNVVNGVAPHPYLPWLATCGIDNDGKVWVPGKNYSFDPDKARKQIEENRGQGDSDDEGISLVSLWNLMAMLRRREEQRQQEEMQDRAEAEFRNEATWEQSTLNQTIRNADNLRQEGNSCFGEGNWQEALTRYQSAIEILEGIELPNAEDEQGDSITKRWKASLVRCLLNKAAVGLKLEQFQDVIEDCGQVEHVLCLSVSRVLSWIC